MDKKHYDEMISSLEILMHEMDLSTRKIFLFGHCGATLELVDLLILKGLSPYKILDNSDEKQGIIYKTTEVIKPDKILDLTENAGVDDSIVLITSRFYEAMASQLRELGYSGPIRKLIDYNTFANYSLSDETIAQMTARVEWGESKVKELSDKYPGYFKVMFPFGALGDIYLAMSYWKPFAEKRNIEHVIFCVAGKVLKDVINLFDDYDVEVFDSKKLDAMIQACLYSRDENFYIPHQDRPYVVNLHKALYVKLIPLETIYCCGVYGLPKDTKPTLPDGHFKKYHDLDRIPKGKSVIFSPYAKSIPSLPDKVWDEAVRYYSEKGYKCFTNVVGDEKPLDKTEAVSPSIAELKSLVEHAGTFVGIRSGLCDVIREAKAKKIALYPDYSYCDTKWKAIEMYWINQFDYNLPLTEEIKWETL